MDEEKVQFQLVRSSRKTLGIQVLSPEKVLLRAPRNMPTAEIRRLVNENRPWIEKHLRMAEDREQKAAAVPPLTQVEMEALARRALKELPPRIGMWAGKIGVSYGRVTIRNQRTRWGSCSAKGNLNFNCLLMLCPEEVIDYVIVHELCHRMEMNHSPRFWAEVEKVLPAWREQRRWLKENGPLLMARQTGHS